MGTRPLTQKEIRNIEARLKEALKEKAQLDGYVAGLEKKLRAGTVWEYEPKVFKQMCTEVERECDEFQRKFKLGKYSDVDPFTGRRKEVDYGNQ